MRRLIFLVQILVCFSCTTQKEIDECLIEKVCKIDKSVNCFNLNFEIVNLNDEAIVIPISQWYFNVNSIDFLMNTHIKKCNGSNCLYIISNDVPFRPYIESKYGQYDYLEIPMFFIIEWNRLKKITISISGDKIDSLCKNKIYNIEGNLSYTSLSKFNEFLRQNDIDSSKVRIRDDKILLKIDDGEYSQYTTKHNVSHSSILTNQIVIDKINELFSKEIEIFGSFKLY